MEQTTLYYRQGSSDKVYRASIEPNNSGYVVKFEYGRRGAAMQTGTKTPVAVNLESARAIYEKLVNQKKAKGYTPGEDGTPYHHSDREENNTGILPQLLNPIEESDVPQLINDPAYCAQEKFDGKRILLQKEGAAINGINRKGLLCGIPSVLINEVKQIPGDCIIDGECIGEIYWAFDVLMLHGNDVREQPYRDRLFMLAQIVSGEFGFIKLADTAYTTAEKSVLLDRMKKEQREGVVFKRLDAAYTPGRPNSGGNQLKCKLYATASFIVWKVNAKRSVSLALWGISKAQVTPTPVQVSAGNVTIPPNHPVPKVGTVVEVRYLYAFKESGIIYQPVYLGQRSDIDPDDCLVKQLKYKPV
jgi:bifunctional non-homologous end joining protein LigD